MEKGIASVPLPREELQRRLGPLIQKTVEDLRQVFPPPPTRPLLHLGRDILFRFVERGLQDVQSWFPTSMPQTAAATRSLNTTPNFSETEIPFHQAVYQGEGCTGRLLITLDAGGLTKFYFCLEDESREEITPIYLTVKDLQGNILRARTALRGKSQPVGEVPMGNYDLFLEDASGKRQVTMGVRSAQNP